MKSNIGNLDRNIRLMAGMVLLVTGIMLNNWSGLLGVALLVTAIMDWCPLYSVLQHNSPGNGVRVFNSHQTRRI
jgi:hypothetical protein